MSGTDDRLTGHVCAKVLAFLQTVMSARAQHTRTCDVRDPSRGLFVHEYVELLALCCHVGKRIAGNSTANLHALLSVVIGCMVCRLPGRL